MRSIPCHWSNEDGSIICKNDSFWLNFIKPQYAIKPIDDCRRPGQYIEESQAVHNSNADIYSHLILSKGLLGKISKDLRKDIDSIHLLNPPRLFRSYFHWAKCDMRLETKLTGSCIASTFSASWCPLCLLGFQQLVFPVCRIYMRSSSAKLCT